MQPSDRFSLCNRRGSLHLFGKPCKQFQRRRSIVFLAAAIAAAAQTDTNAPSRPRAMSLQDCIQEALQHNFDVQIERYQSANLALQLERGLRRLRSDLQHFRPAQLQRSRRAVSIRIRPTKLRPRVSDANSFNSGLTGTLPLGIAIHFQRQHLGAIWATEAGLPFDSSCGSIGVTLTQPLLKNFWIDSTRLNIRVAKNQLKYSEQGLRQQLITSVTAVENAYYELIYAQENVKVQQEALDLAQTQLDQDKQRVQIGTLAILSVQQDESQVAQSQANLIAAQNTLDTDQNTLKNLLTDNYSKWHDTDIQPTATLDSAAAIV